MWQISSSCPVLTRRHGVISVSNEAAPPVIHPIRSLPEGVEANWDGADSRVVVAGDNLADALGRHLTDTVDRQEVLLAGGHYRLDRPEFVQ